MKHLDLLITLAIFTLLNIILILSYKITSHIYDFLERIKGMIIFQKCRKKGILHNINNPYYIWRRRKLMMDGRNPEELTFEEYESHFINDNFYGE